MNLTDAQQYMSGSNAGSIPWDDATRASANNIINGTEGNGIGSVPKPGVSSSGLNGDSIDPNALPSAVGFAQNLNNSEDQAYKDYALAARSQAKPLDIYNQLENQAGIPQLRTTASTLMGQVSSLEDTINRVEGNVNATTGNSYTTEAQRQGLVTAGKTPLLNQLNPLATALGRVQSGIQNAEGGINNKVGYAMQGQQQELEPYKVKMQQMADHSARLMTGFTQDHETQLTLLMDKLQRQRTLSDREWQQAADLAKMEKEYSLRKDEAASQIDSNAKRYISLGDKSSLYDTTTGKFISAPSTSSGGGGTGDIFGGGSDWGVSSDGFDYSQYGL